jgi:hypothetical protein
LNQEMDWQLPVYSAAGLLAALAYHHHMTT